VECFLLALQLDGGPPLGRVGRAAAAVRAGGRRFAHLHVARRLRDDATDEPARGVVGPRGARLPRCGRRRGGRVWEAQGAARLAAEPRRRRGPDGGVRRLRLRERELVRVAPAHALVLERPERAARLFVVKLIGRVVSIREEGVSTPNATRDNNGYLFLQRFQMFYLCSYFLSFYLLSLNFPIS